LFAHAHSPRIKNDAIDVLEAVRRRGRRVDAEIVFVLLRTRRTRMRRVTMPHGVFRAAMRVWVLQPMGVLRDPPRIRRGRWEAPEGRRATHERWCEDG
jgi:hypothetical protein